MRINRAYFEGMLKFDGADRMLLARMDTIESVTNENA